MQSTSPLFSVLINNYNYAPFIEQAVKSVLDQSYQNFEIIIVDDGSTDDSKKVIQQLNDPRITKIFKINEGQGSAFNLGFEASKGELVAFLDSDDWWMPNKLEVMLKWHLFLEGKYSMLQHSVEVWDDGKTYPFKPALHSGDLFRHTVKTGEMGLFVGSSGLVFQRHLLKKVMPIPLDFRISADAYLTRSTFTLGFVYSIPESLSYYRKHNNAVFGNSGHNHHLFHKNILFPHLNRFYVKNKIDFRFKTKDEIPVQFTTYEKYLMMYLLRKKFDEITEKYNRVAFFGTGSHTEWFSTILSGYKKDKIVAVLDITPPINLEFFGLAPVNAQEWSPKEADAIILSTNSMQDLLIKRCRELYGPDIPLINLYEDELKW